MLLTRCADACAPMRVPKCVHATTRSHELRPPAGHPGGNQGPPRNDTKTSEASHLLQAVMVCATSRGMSRGPELFVSTDADLVAGRMHSRPVTKPRPVALRWGRVVRMYKFFRLCTDGWRGIHKPSRARYTGPRPGPRPRIAAARTKPCGLESRSGSRATTGGTAGVGRNR